MVDCVLSVCEYLYSHAMYERISIFQLGDEFWFRFKNFFGHSEAKFFDRFPFFSVSPSATAYAAAELSLVTPKKGNYVTFVMGSFFLLSIG